MMSDDKTDKQNAAPVAEKIDSDEVTTESPKPQEVDGPKGPEPTRYGDWEKKGRCIDF